MIARIVWWSQFFHSNLNKPVFFKERKIPGIDTLIDFFVNYVRCLKREARCFLNFQFLEQITNKWSHLKFYKMLGLKILYLVQLFKWNRHIPFYWFSVLYFRRSSVLLMLAGSWCSLLFYFSYHHYYYSLLGDYNNRWWNFCEQP